MQLQNALAYANLYPMPFIHQLIGGNNHGIRTLHHGVWRDSYRRRSRVDLYARL